MARVPSEKPDSPANGKPAGIASDEITTLLRRSARGDREAEEELISRIYARLRRMARSELARWPAAAGTQATGLVHTLYLELVREREREWPGRRYFFGAFARALHELLIDRARRRAVRGRRQELSRQLPDGNLPIQDEEIEALRDHLERLDRIRPRAAEVFRTHFLIGLTIPEIAVELELGHATVERDLRFARTWLHERMRPSTARGER
jgi:RNA polymerase sigma factor (TIGR02999 family)